MRFVLVVAVAGSVGAVVGLAVGVAVASSTASAVGVAGVAGVVHVVVAVVSDGIVGLGYDVSVVAVMVVVVVVKAEGKIPTFLKPKKLQRTTNCNMSGCRGPMVHLWSIGPQYPRM